MIRPRNEHTIGSECVIAGRGYWSGREIVVRFRPAKIGTGVQFVRVDLAGHPSCPATSAYVSAQSMRTNLIRGDASFQMVEHVMAALYALEIDNCVVECSGEEMPGLDGSSLAYVEALQNAGMVMQAAARKRFMIERSFRVCDDLACIEVSPVSGRCATFEYRLDYGDHHPIVAQRFCHSLTPNNFVRELAAARTFVTHDQADRLKASGVGRHVTNRDLIVFDDAGQTIENELRFVDECARHKTLDMIGDVAMTGVDLVGRFVSYRGGHQLNHKMASLLRGFADGSHMSSGAGSQSAPPVSAKRAA